MDNSSKIIEEANFYLASDFDMGTAAKKMGISRRTLQLHFKKLKNIDQNLYDLVCKRNIQNIAKQEHPTIITEEQLKKEAEEFLTSDLTIKEMAKKLGISENTLILHFEKIKDLFPKLYEEIKKKAKQNIINQEEIPIEQCIIEAQEYLKSDYTIKQLANILGIKESTLRRHFEKIKNYDYELYSLIKLKSKKNRFHDKVYDESYIEEANEYITNNLSMEETAKKLGISLSTLQKHFQKIREIDINLYEQIAEKNRRQIKKGNITGGQIGKATRRYTDEEILVIVQEIIKSELSYEEASEIFGIPKSTIYELTHSDAVSKELKDKLDVVAEANIRKRTVSFLIEENTRRGIK